MKNNLVDIFIGSDIEANYIASLLIDNQIQCIVKNNFEASISAGWVSCSPSNSSSVCVNTEDAEKAQKIIHEYSKV